MNFAPLWVGIAHNGREHLLLWSDQDLQVRTCYPFCLDLSPLHLQAVWLRKEASPIMALALQFITHMTADILFCFKRTNTVQAHFSFRRRPSFVKILKIEPIHNCRFSIMRARLHQQLTERVLFSLKQTRAVEVSRWFNFLRLFSATDLSFSTIDGFGRISEACLMLSCKMWSAT